MPTRIDRPACGNKAVSTRRARSRSSARRDSISVITRLSAPLPAQDALDALLQGEPSARRGIGGSGGMAMALSSEEAVDPDRSFITKSLFQTPGLPVVGWVQPTIAKPWDSVGCTHPTGRLGPDLGNPHAARIDRVDAAQAHRTSLPPLRFEQIDELERGIGDDRAGPEDRDGARMVQFFVVLRRDHAADDDQDVIAAELVERCGSRRHERQVAGGQRADADDVDVVVDRLCAASSGVWNSGPTSTSKPKSANAVAMTCWPRSWPSWPSFATRSAAVGPRAPGTVDPSLDLRWSRSARPEPRA